MNGNVNLFRPCSGHILLSLLLIHWKLLKIPLSENYAEMPNQFFIHLTCTILLRYCAAFLKTKSKEFMPSLFFVQKTCSSLEEWSQPCPTKPVFHCSAIFTFLFLNYMNPITSSSLFFLELKSGQFLSCLQNTSLFVFYLIVPILNIFL